MPKTKNSPQSDNKSKPETAKPTKTLSPKKQIEADHQAGKHKEHEGNCEFCARRASRSIKKGEATKRFFASAK